MKSERRPAPPLDMRGPARASLKRSEPHPAGTSDELQTLREEMLQGIKGWAARITHLTDPLVHVEVRVRRMCTISEAGHLLRMASRHEPQHAMLHTELFDFSYARGRIVTMNGGRSRSCFERSEEHTSELQS